MLDALGRGPAGPVGCTVQRVTFPMNDGTGDILLGRVDRPQVDLGSPLVILVHGITGCEDSAYMRVSAAYFTRLGHPVLRLNLRGSGPSRGACRELYHAGRSADFRTVVKQLVDDWRGRAMVAIGYSLGANMLLKYLGEEGHGTPLQRVVAVSAPIDLATTARQMLKARNALYHFRLLRWLRLESLAAEPFLSAAEQLAIRHARTIYSFDDIVVAPKNGFSGASHYYEESSACRFLASIRIPTLLIHARNDPWIPFTSYQAVDWNSLRSVRLSVTGSGGHVGFHSRDSQLPWHDRCAAGFFEAR